MMGKEAFFTEARRGFHAALLGSILKTDNYGYPSNADKASNQSVSIVRSLDTVSPADLARECLDGWWCGDNVDCAPDDGDLAEAFAELAANRAWLEE